MGLKKINAEHDDVLKRIFALRESDRSWTQVRCQEEFSRLTGVNWSFRLMQRRFAEIINLAHESIVVPVNETASAECNHDKVESRMTRTFSTMSIEDSSTVQIPSDTLDELSASCATNDGPQTSTPVSQKRSRSRALTIRGESMRQSNRKRARRDSLSVEELSSQRESNARQHATRRSNLSVEERSQIRETDALQHATRRSNLSVEERSQERDINALQHATRRSNLSVEEREQQRDYNAQSQRNRRANMSDEQVAYERERNRTYIAQRRGNMNDEDRRAERVRENVRRRVAYQAMTPQQRAEVLGLRRQRQRQREENDPMYKIAVENGEPLINVQPYDMGHMDNECRHCGACYYDDEVNTASRIFTLCCGNGKIDIPKIETFHPVLSALYRYDEAATPLQKETRGHFLDNVRQYNSLLAFGGIRANFDPAFFDNTANNRRNRGFCYRVHGSMYFHIPPIFNAEDDEHRLQSAQFHIHDSDLAHQKRVNAWFPDNGQIDENLLNSLEDVINAVYPYHRLLQNNRVILRNAANGDNAFDCAMFITTRPTPDQRPQQRDQGTEDQVPNGEIAAVFPGDDPPSNLSVAIHPRLNHRIRLSFLNPLVDSILFPLLFPYGELGYQAVPHVRQTLVLNRTTLKEFYCYRLCIRKINDSRFNNALFQSGKLFQEYVCHCYMRVEANDLGWQYRNQQTLRVGDYEHVREVHQRTNPGAEPGDAGYPIILSSTFPGSVRNMRMHYFDTMAIAQHYGKPDFFITFTMNPKRRELTDELPVDYAKHMNRPDLCSRVFELSLKKFYELLDKKHILGRMEAHAGTREYQKTGLPHAHTAWWLEEQDKIRSADDIDKYICAEIPDPDEEPELHELVVKFQLHGPCNGSKPCARAGPTCAKGFPKDFQEVTEFSPGQFAKYRRRDNGRTYVKRGFTFTNQHVVPYNKFLLLYFRCHINIEYCALLNALAYLFKYMCKGSDRINTAISGNNPVDANNIPDPVREVDEDPIVNAQIIADQERALNRYIQDNITDADVIIPLNDIDPVIVGGQADPTTAAFADILNEDLANPIAEGLQVTEEDHITEDNNVEQPAQEPQRQVYDEIRDFKNKRYVSSGEAMDKIYGFSRVVSSHTVYTLKIHDRNRQPVIHTTENRGQALERAASVNTMLTAFFELNRNDPDARQYLYEEIPYHYVFSNGQWTPRQRRMDKTVSRLQFVYPSSRELFHLRLLLQHVRGPQSWDDLLTVDGNVYATFSEACVARHLVENCQHFRDLLEEALVQTIHFHVRFMFAHILIHSNPVNPNPRQLWEEYSERMSLDYVMFQKDPMNVAIQRTLQHIKYLLNCDRKSLADYNLPEPTMDIDWRYHHENVNMLELSPEEYAQRVDEIVPTLNPEQLSAYNAIVQSIETNRRTKLFFIDGPGGTGKTYLINLILMKMASMNKKCQPLAFTGIAAALMEKGQTIHSKFRLKIPSDESCVSKIDAASDEAELLKDTDVFIIDECSQVDKFMMRAIDRCLRDLTGIRNQMFGGKCIILAGDYRQCLPVVKKPSNHRPETIVLKADRQMWQSFERHSLVSNVRADMNANAFKEWCLDIGNGTVPRLPNSSLIRLPDQVICENDLIDSVFGEGRISLESLISTNRAILCPTNQDSLEINELILDRLEGNHRQEYYSVDSMLETDDGAIQPLEYAHQETPNGYPPHELKLKVGAIVMLIKNWNIPLGLCNGTRLRVVQCGNNFIKCAILSGPRKDMEYTFSRVKFTPSEKDMHRIERLQFPFRLAFAMTINKSQGQTFDKIGILLRSPVFSHGQLYVAVSRVRNFESLCFMVETHPPGDKVQGSIPGQVGIFTQNIVNQTMLR